MTNISRRYYERELGAGLGPSPSLQEHFGYSEPLRRFIQRESFEPQANEIPNTMPSWLPGDDYMTNFKVGDPYVRVDDGYARLPGAGYEALHPELEGLNPEDYPDIHKLRILSDVAPYSREYNQVPSSCLTQKTLAHVQAERPSARWLALITRRIRAPPEGGVARLGNSTTSTSLLNTMVRKRRGQNSPMPFPSETGVDGCCSASHDNDHEMVREHARSCCRHSSDYRRLACRYCDLPRCLPCRPIPAHQKCSLCLIGLCSASM